MIYLRDQIRKNKRNSWILIVLITFLLIFTGGLLGMAYQSPLAGLFLSFCLALFLLSLSYWGGETMVLTLMGAREASREQDRVLYDVTEEMAIAGGIPVPKVYLINSTAANAFAVGKPGQASVAVTTGLLQIVNREELQAVVGHEMSHVRNYDSSYAVLMAVLVGTLVMLCDASWRMVSYRSWTRDSERTQGGGGVGVVVVLILALLLSLLAPLLAKLIQYAMSREREYLADQGSVELTRNPEALARALEKIAGDKDPLGVANRGVQHLFIVNPLNPLSEAQETGGWNHWFSTHPPLPKRIQILREMARTFSSTQAPSSFS